MEPRAAIGDFDRATGEYTLYTTSQNPACHPAADGRLRPADPGAASCASSRPMSAAASAPRSSTMPRRPSLTWAAGKIGRPIKWTADRSESFMSDAQGRDHVSHAELAMDKDGKFLALRVSTIANMGAYLSTFAPCVPTYLYGTLLAGVYATPAIYVEVKAVFTNTVAGRCLSRRRAAGGDLPAGAAGRQGGARDEDGPARASAGRTSSRPTPSPIRRRSLCNTTAATIRARWRSPQKKADCGRLREAPGRGEEPRQAARHRLLDLSRGLRHRSLGGGRIARRPGGPL